jgi:hypothetical protein
MLYRPRVNVERIASFGSDTAKNTGCPLTGDAVS